jgi:hypothetical protein
MLRCRNCQHVAEPGQQICLECGGILDYLPDDPPRSSDRTEAKPAPNAHAKPAKANSPSPIGNSSLAGDFDGNSDGDAGIPEPDWKCSKCGESVPGNFDMCWKCMATRSGEPLPAEGQEISDAERPEEDADSTGAQSDDLGDTRLAPELKCRGCGSSKIIHNVAVADRGEYWEGRLRAVVFRNPHALIFSDPVYGEIRADICGECGFVDLHVVNPGELYEQVRKAAASRE